MSAHDRRISKLELESRHCNKKSLLLVERYRGQPIEEAKVEAGISSENEDGYKIIFMTGRDAETL